METIRLNNEVEMPLLGYGLFKVDPKESERCTKDALILGYRMIDTAQFYANEEGVGKAQDIAHKRRQVDVQRKKSPKSFDLEDFKGSGSYLLSHLVGQYHRRW